MRTIKFRAKTHNGTWMYGIPIRDWEDKWYIIEYIDSELYVEDNDQQDCMGEMRRFGCKLTTDGDFYMEEVRPETIGQFIGVYDNKGKEIYEGDIVETLPYKDRLEVIYNPNDAEYLAVCDKGKLSFSNSYITLQVIGNIHDNRELLRNSK
jgi:uncharacterized phage protein (TIGR01671 family)